MRRRPNILTLCGLLLACLTGAGGCTTVTPPPRPADPVTVYLCDYGVHSSLLLPTNEGRFVEYAWGDWGYSAKNSVGPHDALGALFLSGSSAFGRRYHDAYQGKPPAVLHNGPDQTATVWPIEAPRERVSALVRDLDERYAEGAAGGRTLFNPINEVTYVRDRRHYSIFNNCNHFTNACLERLGCRIGGFTAYANFAVSNPPGGSEKTGPPATLPPASTSPTSRPSTVTALKAQGERIAPANSRTSGTRPIPLRAGLDMQ